MFGEIAALSSEKVIRNRQWPALTEAQRVFKFAFMALVILQLCVRRFIIERYFLLKSLYSGSFRFPTVKNPEKIDKFREKSKKSAGSRKLMKIDLFSLAKSIWRAPKNLSREVPPTEVSRKVLINGTQYKLVQIKPPFTSSNKKRLDRRQSLLRRLPPLQFPHRSRPLARVHHDRSLQNVCGTRIVATNYAGGGGGNRNFEERNTRKNGFEGGFEETNLPKEKPKVGHLRGHLVLKRHVGKKWSATKASLMRLKR